MALDAEEVLARQETAARRTRQQLEKEHAVRAKTAPSSAAQNFGVGDPMWILRSRHRTKIWFTAGEVVRRIGEDTYRIKVGPRQFRKRHEGQLCAREPDVRGKNVSLDYTTNEANSNDEYAEHDDYTVAKILAKRFSASAPGGVEFQVRWRGYRPSHDTFLCPVG